jgi:hypothetical protein
MCTSLAPLPIARRVARGVGSVVRVAERVLRLAVPVERAAQIVGGSDDEARLATGRRPHIVDRDDIAGVRGRERDARVVRRDDHDAVTTRQGERQLAHRGGIGLPAGELDDLEPPLPRDRAGDVQARHDPVGDERVRRIHAPLDRLGE